MSGVGKTGVVGVITGKMATTNDHAKVIGLRADMGALPIEEKTNLPYASKNKGFMHACGHDGHTAMLLGAARYLAETRNFAGAAVLIFQPAEEIGMGASAMLEDDLIGRFGIEQVCGMANGDSAGLHHAAYISTTMRFSMGHRTGSSSQRTRSRLKAWRDEL
ncbi:hypothetical protein X769_33085 [Mesorhizobium sp. LSJC268A00]|nr:hypothetical protein X769_33085 [Mesorhizobium sp. LSJC268A00]